MTIAAARARTAPTAAVAMSRREILEALNFGAVPGPALSLIRAAYGDATGHVFLISAVVTAAGLVAALLLKPSVLRSSIDLPDAR